VSKSRSVNHLQLSILISVSLFLTTLTFRAYFYYTPFTTGVDLLSFLQFLTICGWVLLVAAPPLFFASEYKWTVGKYWGFLVSVTLWTVSTFLIKIYTLVSIGIINYQYLTSFPILIYLEWIVPALYVYLAVKYYKPVTSVKPKNVTNRVRFDDEVDTDSEPRSTRREKFDD
jgi:hypothetical protein